MLCKKCTGCAMDLNEKWKCWGCTNCLEWGVITDDDRKNLFIQAKQSRTNRITTAPNEIVSEFSLSPHKLICRSHQNCHFLCGMKLESKSWVKRKIFGKNLTSVTYIWRVSPFNFISRKLFLIHFTSKTYFHSISLSLKPSSSNCIENVDQSTHITFLRP